MHKSVPARAIVPKYGDAMWHLDRVNRVNLFSLIPPNLNDSDPSNPLLAPGLPPVRLRMVRHQDQRAPLHPP